MAIRKEHILRTVTPIGFDQWTGELAINQQAGDVHTIRRNRFLCDCPIVVSRDPGIRIIGIVIGIFRGFGSPWKPVRQRLEQVSEMVKVLCWRNFPLTLLVRKSPRTFAESVPRTERTAPTAVPTSSPTLPPSVKTEDAAFIRPPIKLLMLTGAMLIDGTNVVSNETNGQELKDLHLWLIERDRSEPTHLYVPTIFWQMQHEVYSNRPKPSEPQCLKPTVPILPYGYHHT